MTDNIGFLHPVPDGSGKRFHLLRYMQDGVFLCLGEPFQELVLILVVRLLFAFQYGQSLHELVRHGVSFQQIGGITLDHDKGFQHTFEACL